MNFKPHFCYHTQKQQLQEISNVTMQMTPCILTGSSCESSISAAERPDMSAHSAYSLYLESLAGPCFTPPQKQRQTGTESMVGAQSYIVPHTWLPPPLVPWSESLSCPYQGSISRKAVAMKEVGHPALISSTRLAGEARVARVALTLTNVLATLFLLQD